MEIKTLDRLFRDYLDHRESLNYSPKTIKRIQENLSLFVKWIAQTHTIETADMLRASHLRAWQQYLLGRKLWNGLPISPKTVNDYLTHTTGFLSYLADRGYVLRGLIDTLERVKTDRLLPRSVLEHAQMKKLLRRIDTSNRYGYRDRAIIELLYSSGLRANEALGLDLKHVNFEQRTAWVMGKGRKERVVPIGRAALRFLRSYIVGVRPSFVADPNEQAVFLDRDGKRYAYHNLQCSIRRFTRTMGFDFPITAHTFRRSCTTELIRGGANIYHVKEFLGHESLDTLKHYTRLTIVDLKKTHEKCHPREADEPPES